MALQVGLLLGIYVELVGVRPRKGLRKAQRPSRKNCCGQDRGKSGRHAQERLRKAQRPSRKQIDDL